MASGSSHVVIPGDCPDPGVIRDGVTYVLTCTSGDAADAFPIYTSPDGSRWTLASHVFPSGKRPSWAAGDFWAPEIHFVGAHYVAYYSARGTDGMLAIGAATAPRATGPFTDIGVPLLRDAHVGLIDPNEITTTAHVPYLLWKEDGNACGKPTLIRAQRLSPDGVSVVGAASTLLTNDQPWEGAVTEAPFMVERGGAFYLFYSGNSYADSSYAVGVARGISPLGPMAKRGAPILTTHGAWTGPGHCSVVDAASGTPAIIYHAWPRACSNHHLCGRAVLMDKMSWGADGWPHL